MKNFKTFLLVIFGNILDYYDFLLFAHLGPVITKFFIPNLTPKEAHIMSLLLFSIPFILRPVGGFIFGKLADTKGRHFALSETLKYASFASIGLAILPSYEIGGIICSILFLALRALQGLSLGGEYNTAGTFLMEKFQNNQGLISGTLCASGTVGSLIAFSFSYLYIKEYITGEYWRVAFLLGGLGTYVSYILRKKTTALIDTYNYEIKTIESTYANSLLITFLIGALVSILVWLPMVYSNFYLTKILNLSVDTGLQATFISLVLYIILNILFGKLSDIFGEKFIMTLGSILAIPFGVVGYYMITKGMLLGQLFLVLGSSMFGAPIHVLMNQLFLKKNRSKSVNTFFMMGTSVGGLTPFLSGYLIDQHQFHDAPVALLIAISASIFIIFYNRFYRK